MKWKYTIYLLTLVMLTVWLAVLLYPQQNLQIITCDVGQGDATLLIHGKKQILIDGGPNNKVVDCIDHFMPFWDRNIELVILTHPEKDHFFGLIEVFERYSVQVLLATGLDNSSNEYQVLKTTIGGKGVAVVNPKEVVKIRLGMIHLDILHPPDSYFKDFKVVAKDDLTADVLGVYSTSRDANDFSIVNLVKYGNFRALMTGDIMQDATADLLKNNGMSDVNYIKVPHHGSKNGLTESLLNAVKPEVAVISVGKNSYGHPHKEILKLLEDNNIRVLRTDELGDVVVVTDGEKIWIKD